MHYGKVSARGAIAERPSGCRNRLYTTASNAYLSDATPDETCVEGCRRHRRRRSCSFRPASTSSRFSSPSTITARTARRMRRPSTSQSSRATLPTLCYSVLPLAHPSIVHSRGGGGPHMRAHGLFHVALHVRRRPPQPVVAHAWRRRLVAAAAGSGARDGGAGIVCDRKTLGGRCDAAHAASQQPDVDRHRSHPVWSHQRLLVVHPWLAVF